MTPDFKKAVFKTVATGTDRWIREAQTDVQDEELRNLKQTFAASGPRYGEFLQWYGLKQTQLALTWYFICASGHADTYKPGVFAYNQEVVGATFPFPSGE